jgi:dipeptidyl-peptidase-4
MHLMMGAYIRYVYLALSFFFLISKPQVSASQDFSTCKRTTDIAQKDRDVYTQAAAVRPHWISRSNKFWFRRSNAPGDSTFVYIDPNQGLRQPAFDHDGVARALRQKGVEASAANLPFAWIDVIDNCAAVRFRAGEKNWEWTKYGVLAPFEGDIYEGDTTEMLKPLAEERQPVNSSGETAIKFINRTKGRVSLYWIDWFGKEKYYQDVEAGRTVTQQTSEGHVWRITRAEDGEAIASFAAKSEVKVAVIEEGLPTARPLAEALGSLSKRQSNGTTDGSGVFFRDNNVWFRDTNGQEIKISTTGTEDSPFSNWTYPSPDNKFVVAFQSTRGQEHFVYAVESSPYEQVQPRLHQFQYLKPGDNVTIDRPRIFDLTNKQEITTEDALFQNPYQLYALNGGWNAEGTEFRFVYNQRGHQVLRVVGMNTQGDVRAVIEETSKTFVDYANKLYYRELINSNSSELIWASERDGWNHLYLYDMKSGKVKNQITKGEWVVRSVDYVDEAKRQIWIKVLGAAPGQDPYYAHLARVNFDGSDFKILTEGDGTHSWYFSEDRTTFTDTWSRMDMAYTTVTRDAEIGNATTDISAGNLDWVLWPVPERFAALGRDNSTLIYGLIFRPYEMDNSTKYPVIEKIYAGPQDFFVPKEYMLHDEAHQLANQGFVVVLIDGMGTNWRSRAFHDVCHKNLKDAGFPDRIAWMKAAASTRPWMDIGRVGVYGGSAGGQNAMGALLFHNDFYSVAAADCGCHDNRMDKLWWNEAWMGYPVDQSYEDSSNVVNAKKLIGSLMLTVGELDTNVDPASTMQVVNALNNAEKDYDFLFVPGGEHGVATNNAYAARRTREFLYRKLKGTEPPKQ